MSRKLLSLIVAIAVVLSSVSVAFAAVVPSDVTADYVKAVSKLGSLNIMNGYPDGTFKPDQTITRAEFAKIAVVALGLNDSATISAGATSFSDVASTHWASGFINVASSQGIINGYPDGTYKPEQTINYAEAITILAKMLGYGPILAGKAWPAAYVAKANEIGLTSGVVLATSIGASRGNVAKLMSNTLSTKMVNVDSYDSEGKPVYKVGSTDADQLMAKKLSVEPLKVGTKDVLTVTDTPSLQATVAVGASTLTNELAATTTAKFVAALDAEDYLGLDIKAWKNSDGDVVIAEVQNAAADIYNGIVVKDTATKLKLVGTAKSYEGAAAFAGTVNNTGCGTLAAVITALGTDKATAKVVIKDGKIKSVYAYTDKTAGKATTFTVKEVKDGYIKAINANPSDIKISDLTDEITTKDVRLDVIKGGVAATLADIVAGDVVTRIVDTDYERWIVTAATAEGALTAVSGTGADMTLTVGGTDYTLATGHVFTFDGGDNYNKTFANVADIVGKDITLTLNSNGQVQNIKSTAAQATYLYGVFRSSTQNVGTNGSDTNVVLYKADGTKVTYILDDPAETDNVAALADTSAPDAAVKGALVQYQLTADGKIKDDSLKFGGDIVTDLTCVASNNNVTAIADNTITLGATVYPTLTSTVIYDVYDLVNSNGDAKVVPYSAIKGKVTRGVVDAYNMLVSGITTKYVVVNYGDVYPDGTTSTATGLSSATTGVVLSTGIDADGQTVTVNEGGTVKTYKLTTVTSANFISKQYASYTVNSAGKINSVSAVGSYVYEGVDSTVGNETGKIYRVQSVDTGTSVIEVKAISQTDYMDTGSAIYFRYNSDTAIYDASDDSAPATTIKGAQAATILSAGDYIWVNDTNTANVLTAMVKVKKDNITDSN